MKALRSRIKLELLLSNITPMNEYGEVRINFVQDIMMPITIDQRFWDEILWVSVTNLSDDKVTSVKFDTTEFRRLEVSPSRIEKEEVNRMSYKPSVSNFNESTIIVKYNFDHPEELGLSG